MQKKWAAQKQLEAATRQEEQNSRDAVVAERLRIKQQKEEIRRRAIAKREVEMRSCTYFAYFLGACLLLFLQCRVEHRWRRTSGGGN